MSGNQTTNEKDRRFAPMAELAGQQKGLVTRGQLRDLGYTDKTIESAIRTGRMWIVHRGVYAVGFSKLPRLGWEMAAVLACGPDRTLVSHTSAAFVWGILHPNSYQRYNSPPRVEVSVIGGQPKRYRVTSSRIDRIDDVDRARIEGVPVTSPHRTLLDLAGGSDLRIALNNARAKGLVDNEGLEKVMNRYPFKNGIGDFRKETGFTDFSRSKAEDVLYELIEQRDLPRPQRNQWVAGHEVDFYWPQWDLVVEVDGYQFHGTKDRFEHDHVRDTDLGLADVTVLRFTWRQITRSSDRVAHLIESHLLKAEARAQLDEITISAAEAFRPSFSGVFPD